MVMPLDDSTRPSLLLRLRDRSDRLSWQDFHRLYGQLLYRYARSRGVAHEDAEDIVQEVESSFFKAVDHFEYDAKKGRFRAYLRSAVVHAMARHARRQANNPQKLDPQLFDLLAEGQQDESDEAWEREWQLNELREAMEQVVAELDETALKAFELHVLAGRSVVDTADMLQISKWRVYRARNRVLDRLRRWSDTRDAPGAYGRD
jgi:RNA polymerase sigma factor (sigma-70 family)